MIRKQTELYITSNKEQPQYTEYQSYIKVQTAIIPQTMLKQMDRQSENVAQTITLSIL